MTAKKKIFDITPPEFITPSREQPELKGKIKRRIKKAPILIVLGIILVVVFAYVFIKPKAEIEIWPEKNSVEFETETTLAGEVFKTEKSVSQEFSSTGSKSKAVKAHGIIRVYNAHSVYSQSLVATTRFVSDSGKLFRTPDRIVVPGGHYEGGKLVPGYIDIEVVAAEAGEDYNIGPATFSIPGFAGTDKYTTFYAKSFKSMTGGMEAETHQVTKEDLEQAQEILTEQALKECKESLEDSISSEDYLVLQEGISQEITEITPLAEAGQELESFLFQVKAEAKAKALKKSELEDFAETYILDEIPLGKELKEGSMNIEYSSQSFDLEEGKITLALTIRAEIYSVVNEVAVKETVKNLRLVEVSGALRKFSEVDGVEAKLWPFWAGKVPEDTERINIKLNLD